MADQYITLRAVQDRVAQHPLMQSIPFDAIVRNTIDFMRIVGVPRIFIEKTVKETSDNKGRVKLPCDYVELIQMRGRHGMYRYTSDSFHSGYEKRFSCGYEEKKDHAESHLIGIKRGNDEFVSNTTAIIEDHNPPMHHWPANNTFLIQNGYIYLSRKHDTVEIAYRAIPTDSEGLPMVPDNSKFMRALLAYIKQEYFTILFDTGLISQQVFNQAQQDYGWAVGACETEFLKIDLSKSESVFNAINSMVPHWDQFKHGFVDNNVKTEMRGV